ncbi:antibiotic biosynthesis monooxygenase [Micromonospora sp. CPCC 205539]|uniref:antibiotic biosynthesis monooxygenase family protein n=1 Tax=Micromonospora sp. CPCC 205539 TaxID=3122408 RepID=UPI002FF28525
MAVVKINAIEVPPGAGAELEKRFAARAGTVENSPGFLGFELLRPVAGETRYFVYTRWETEEAYQAWAAGPSRTAHAAAPGDQQRPPVSSGASLLEFEVALEVPQP